MAMTKTIQSIIVPTQFDSALMELARTVKAAADEAWDLTAKAATRGDVTTETYQRGRAHALCEVLGDQESLFAHGVLD